MTFKVDLPGDIKTALDKFEEAVFDYADSELEEYNDAMDTMFKARSDLELAIKDQIRPSPSKTKADVRYADLSGN